MVLPFLYTNNGFSLNNLPYFRSFCKTNVFYAIFHQPGMVVILSDGFYSVTFSFLFRASLIVSVPTSPPTFSNSSLLDPFSSNL